MIGPHTRALLLAVCFATLGPPTAHAYCRTTTTQQDGSCECEKGGIPLAWRSPSLHYSLHEDLFPGLDESELRSIFAVSFEAWTDVRCDGEPTGLTVEAEAELTDQEPGSIEDYGDDDLNVMQYLPPEEWADDPRVFAYTHVWFNDKSGQILGVDMVFNGGLGPFGRCPATGCEPGLVDLQNVVTHEAGHFLGLAHSADADATMTCSAARSDLAKRSLAGDDEAGLCAVYPPGEAFTESSADDGCALSARGSQTPALGWVLLALVARRLGIRSRPSA